MRPWQKEEFRSRRSVLRSPRAATFAASAIISVITSPDSGPRRSWRPSSLISPPTSHREGSFEKPPEDSLLEEIRNIVGRDWATNDRAIAVAYSFDPCPLASLKMPAYVVMPATREEISALLKLFTARGIQWVVRGNRTNILGFALSEGAVIDLNRMKNITFDEKNWAVNIGPGVTAFELQREAVKRGYRVNVAEPAAAVCASIMTSGILSLFSAGYGTCASSIINAGFVSRDGACYSLNDKDAPNLFAFTMADVETPGICTGATVKLHPMTDDKTGVLVPFNSLEKAVAFAKECALRRIGLAIGILGLEYVSSFMAPTRQMAAEAREVFGNTLGIAHLVLVIGDAYAMRSVSHMGYPLIDQRLFTILSLGLPSLASAEWLDLAADLSEDEPFSYLKVEGFADLAEAALTPSAAQLVRDLDPDLRSFYEELYARPEMTNLVALNMFRISSSRIGREKHFFPILMYLPLDYVLIDELAGNFKRIADRYRLKNAFGFITPVDNGKRCIFEYDYFLDPNNEGEIARTQQAAAELGAVIEEYSVATGTIRWLRYLLYQGCCRMENFLYVEQDKRRAPGIWGLMGETVTLTGATGFLGSHLMAALLERGRKLIILGRASEEGSLAQRIADLLAWFGLEELNGQIETKEVDLLKPSLGLNGPEYHELCAGRTESFTAHPTPGFPKAAAANRWTQTCAVWAG